LTAILKLQRCHSPSARDLRSRSSGRSREPWDRSVLAGAAIDSPSERHLPAAVFSTACRACDVASDALCRVPRMQRVRPKPEPMLHGPRERQVSLRRRLVKDSNICGPVGRSPTDRVTRAPSIDECSRLPARFREGIRDTRDHGLATMGPSRRSFTPSARPEGNLPGPRG
jgi:hypothetical protein